MKKVVLVGMIAATQLVGATWRHDYLQECFEAVGRPPRGGYSMTGKGAPKWTVRAGRIVAEPCSSSPARPRTRSR